MNYKYGTYGTQAKLPYFCYVCGESLMEGLVKKADFDEFDGEQIFRVQLHCPKASKKELASGEEGGLNREHSITYRYLKKRDDKNDIPF